MKIILILMVVLVPLNIGLASSETNYYAESAIVMDQNSGKIFYSKDINKIKTVASISKIMTAVVVLENIDIEKYVIVGKEIDLSYGSSIYLSLGEKIKIKDLLYGLMLRSGNDAALVLAKNTFGNLEKFIIEMNKKAVEIGMSNTTFNNPSGLDEEKGNYSTAYDIAILTSYAMKNKIYQKIVSTKNYKSNTNLKSYTWKNKNKLLFDYNKITGGKTGYTKKAKRTLVTTATDKNLSIVVVTLNASNDFEMHKKYYKNIFENYKSYSIIKKGGFNIHDDKIYNKYHFYIKEKYDYPLTPDEAKSIVLKIKLNNTINKEKAGKVEIYLGDEKLTYRTIYLKQKKEKQTFIKKIIKYIF